ncbi:MAG TPA: pyrroline-5-carboxylate reductase dimerization domain-containing protein [Bacteriovoracaceae bacterium]|nr:pyrroline-5-carboxylate reductase dimerization domain-containing protein [Bacteriovoracaceae bacterium]
MRVLVLGAGKMAQAILKGLAETESLSEWGIYSPSGVSAKKLSEETGAQFITDLNTVNPEWVLLGCKPQQLDSQKKTFPDALYISLLAAIGEESQVKILGVKRLVRVMPNLSVRYRQGVSLISSSSGSKEVPKVLELFSKLGMARVMNEAELEELTLLTGSGPALFYEFTLNLAQNFNSLTEAERETLSRQVLLGAALNAKSENIPLQTMIDSVTSKGGVTIAVLEEWRSKGLVGLLKMGIEAGKKRTQELKKIILQS